MLTGHGNWVRSLAFNTVRTAKGIPSGLRVFSDCWMSHCARRRDLLGTWEVKPANLLRLVLKLPSSTQQLLPYECFF